MKRTLPAVIVALVTMVVVPAAPAATLNRTTAKLHAIKAAKARGATGTLVVSCRKGHVRIPCSVRFTRGDGSPCTARMTVRRSRTGKLRTVGYRTACQTPPAAPAVPPVAAEGPPTAPPVPPVSTAPAEPPSGVPSLPPGLVLPPPDPSALRAVGSCYPTGWWPSYADRPARWYVAPEGYAWVAHSWACPDNNVSVFAYYYWDGYQWTYWAYAIRGLYQGPAG